MLENSPLQSPAVPLARLCEPHGYRLDGDTVFLNARIAILEPAAHEVSWALQLWACSAPPATVRELSGHKVAEVALPPIAEIAGGAEPIESAAFAWPPAGSGEHVMVLVLASGRPGEFTVVHDHAVYSRPQQFLHPRMNGSVDYRIAGGRVQISVEHVENPRAAENQSGTLSLELWALPAPFTGGHFEGHHLAGVEVGSLGGRGDLGLPPIDLAFVPPPAGEWAIVLMLREWTGGCFLTRDFTNFPARFISAPVLEKAPAPAIEAPSVAAAAEAVVKPVSAPIPIAPVGETVPPPAPAAAPADASPGCVSVNTARVEELAAVKGLSRKIAEGIVNHRPFASLDDLSGVKGLGKHHLKKIRARLKL